MKDKSESKIVIRRALAKDARALSNLNKQFNGVRIAAPTIRESINQNNTESIFVAEVDKTVVGFASVQITSTFSSERKTAELTDIYVAESGRRKGVGSTLLLVLRKYCEEQDVGEIFLRVNRDNKGAIAFYESHGLIDAQHREFRIRYG